MKYVLIVFSSRDVTVVLLGVGCSETIILWHRNLLNLHHCLSQRCQTYGLRAKTAPLGVQYWSLDEC